MALIIAREVYISGLREYLASRGKALPVSKSGKWKTALQMVGITLMLAAPLYHLTLSFNTYTVDLLWNAGIITFWVAVLLSLVSAVQYTLKALPDLR